MQEEPHTTLSSQSTRKLNYSLLQVMLSLDQILSHQREF